MPLALPASVSGSPKITFDPTVELPAALQLAAHVLYQCVALFVLHISRPSGGLAIALLTPAILEILAFAYYDKKIRVPVSALVSRSGFYLLVESNQLFPYLLGGIVIIASKRFLRVNGKHIFNPSNIALLATVYSLPLGSTSAPGQWDSTILTILFFFCAGTYVAFMANRHVVAFSYLFFFVVVSVFRGLVTSSASPFFYAGTAIGIPQVLFAFHMVTDPRTSPGPKGQQVLYGAMSGMLEAALRWLTFFNAPFLALAAVCAIWPVLGLPERR